MNQRPESHSRFRERINVRGWLTPDSVQKRAQAESIDAAARVINTEGWQHERDVGKDLRVNAARSDQNHGAKLRITPRAQQHLHADRRHLCDDNLRTESLRQVRVSMLELVFVFDLEYDAADIRLVPDVRRRRLECQRVSDLAARFHHLVLRLDEARLDDRNAKRSQQLQTVLLGQRRFVS